MKLHKALIATPFILLGLGLLVVFTIFNPYFFTTKETLADRTPQDITAHFFKDAADGNTAGLARDGADSSMQHSQIFQQIVREGVANIKVTKTLWASDCCDPRLVSPSDSNDTLLTTQVTDRAGGHEVYYIELTDMTPEANQSGLGGFQIIRKWGINNITTQPPGGYWGD